MSIHWKRVPAVAKDKQTKEQIMKENEVQWEENCIILWNEIKPSLHLLWEIKTNLDYGLHKADDKTGDPLEREGEY